MKTDERVVAYPEFLTICHSAKDRFDFLEKVSGLRLTEEAWPAGDSFRDGFHLSYTGHPVSVLVEYYDMELVIWFKKSHEKVPYLFIDHELMNNRSGFAGCMFPRNKLADAVSRMADDIRLHYDDVLAGDVHVWQRLCAAWNAPREKKRLP